MKKISFAQRARQIINKYKTRLGDDLSKADPLALEAFNAEMGRLKNQQEEVRTKLGLVDDVPMGLNGLDLTRLKYPKTDWSSYLQLDPSVMEPPQFAKPLKAPQPAQKTMPEFPEVKPLGTGILREDNGLLPTQNAEATPLTTASKTVAEKTGIPLVTYQEINQEINQDNKNFSQVSPLGLVASVASGLMLAKQARDFETDTDYRPISPRLVNFGEARAQVQAVGQGAKADLLRAARNTGNLPQYLNTIAGGVGEITSKTNEALIRLNTAEIEKNADIINRVNMFNADNLVRARQQKNQLKLYKDRLRAQALDTILSGVARHASDIGKARSMDMAYGMPYEGLYGESYEHIVDPNYKNLPVSQRAINYLTSSPRTTKRILR